MCQKAFFKKICGGCTPGVDPTNEEQSGVIVSQGKNGQDLGLDSNPVEYGKVMGMSLLWLGYAVWQRVSQKASGKGLTEASPGW